MLGWPLQRPDVASCGSRVGAAPQARAKFLVRNPSPSPHCSFGRTRLLQELFLGTAYA